MIVDPSGKPVSTEAPVAKQYLGLKGSELTSTETPQGTMFTQYFVMQMNTEPPSLISCGRFMYATKVQLQENVAVVMAASDGGAQPSQMNLILTQAALKDFIASLAKLITEPTEAHLVPASGPERLNPSTKDTGDGTDV